MAVLVFLAYVSFIFGFNTNDVFFLSFSAAVSYSSFRILKRYSGFWVLGLSYISSFFAFILVFYFYYWVLKGDKATWVYKSLICALPVSLIINIIHIKIKKWKSFNQMDGH